MKIISKFKDYYDHKVGKYGADPLLVFDRRRQEGAAIQHQLPDVPPEWHSEYGSATATLVTLYIGHWRYYLFHAQGRVDGWEEIERMHQQAYSTKRWWQMAWKVCFQDGRAYWMPQLQGIISTQAADRTASLQPQRVSRDGDRLALTGKCRCCWCAATVWASNTLPSATPTRSCRPWASIWMPTGCGSS